MAKRKKVAEGEASVGKKLALIREKSGPRGNSCSTQTGIRRVL